MCHLLRWTQAVRSAEIEADRHLRAARQLARDFTREVDSDPEAVKLSMVASTIGAVADVDEVEQIAELLLHTPLPLPLFAEVSRHQRSAQSETQAGQLPRSRLRSYRSPSTICHLVIPRQSSQGSSTI
jgi:hypothetical protein